MAITASWLVWCFSGLLFWGVTRFLRSMPGARDFRTVVVACAIVGLAASALVPVLRWQLLWFTPLAIAAAYVYAFYVYALRHLFALSRRVNRLGRSGLSDPEAIRQALQSEVNAYNSQAADDAQMK